MDVSSESEHSSSNGEGYNSDQSDNDFRSNDITVNTDSKAAIADKQVATA